MLTIDKKYILDVVQDYKSLQQLISGGHGVGSKGVMWADQTMCSSDLDATTANSTMASGCESIGDVSVMDVTQAQVMVEFNKLMDFPSINVQPSVSKYTLIIIIMYTNCDDEYTLITH